MKDIENDIMNACENGISFVQYKVHKHYYPGYIGDNISFLTGKYYMYNTDTNSYIEIPGAESYIDALKKRLPGLKITFAESEHNNGILRVELVL
jgi:hypothetical protein